MFVDPINYLQHTEVKQKNPVISEVISTYRATFKTVNKYRRPIVSERLQLISQKVKNERSYMDNDKYLSVAICSYMTKC